MRYVELLAPARNADIGIAAIDCGADAVYIAGPEFGARKDAGNPISEIARLCKYASKFRVRVFVTFNILLKDEELERVHQQMLDCQDVGVDAFIIRDPRLCLYKDIHIPFHASTQCFIKDIERAQLFEKAGCSRIVLERQLALSEVRRICASVNCEVECFVHGALCVCYSGVCAMSERLTGRSADRGECIQACRNLYDLVDETGKILGKDKAYLSLKDLNLSDNLESLLDAGVTSFKMEGRLKNIAYVSNVVREYSQRLDEIISGRPLDYARSSVGHVEGGFTPSLSKTFNRSYTSLFFDTTHSWANFTAPKSMGEYVGEVKSIKRSEVLGGMDITIKDAVRDLHNGDGFAFVRGSEIIGFRGDVCKGSNIRSHYVNGLNPGTKLYRNYSAAFEAQLNENKCHRFIPVAVSYKSSVSSKGLLDVAFCALSEDGREVEVNVGDCEKALNQEREEGVYKTQIGKHSSDYAFELAFVQGELAHLSASTLNGVRRQLAELLDRKKCLGAKMLNVSSRNPIKYEIGRRSGELMRSKYCLRAELGCCLKNNKSDKRRLFLVNNGRKFPLQFDCAVCEMAVLDDR